MPTNPYQKPRTRGNKVFPKDSWRMVHLKTAISEDSFRILHVTLQHVAT